MSVKDRRIAELEADVAAARQERDEEKALRMRLLDAVSDQPRVARLEQALRHVLDDPHTGAMGIAIIHEALAGGDTEPTRPHAFCSDTAWTYCLHENGCSGDCEKRAAFVRQMRAGERP